jgi:anthranilate phosphoribosyltransferase
MENTQQLKNTESALRRGIKAVGIGKKGNRCLNRELALEILNQLQNATFKETERAAFFAGLFIKGLTTDEMILSEHFPTGTLENAAKLSRALCTDAPLEIIDICTHLLEQKELPAKTTQQLGQFLLSGQPGDGARAIAAIALRVRYETTEEYLSLLDVLNKSIHPDFLKKPPAGKPIIQLAEPFDGVDHNYLITPCLADFLQRMSYRVLTLVGRNSGPKDGNNLYDLAQKLKLKYLQKSYQLTAEKPKGGFYVDQKDLCPALDRWVDLRQDIIKRPFLATLEKFLNPCKADIIITSAFHGAYGEKMAQIAEQAGFKGSIVVRNGVEGTIAFPLTRPAKLLCSARQNDGTYLRQEIIFDAAQFFGSDLACEKKLENPSLEINANLIQEFFQKAQTESLEFNCRITVTCAGIQKAVQWISDNTNKENL